MAGERQLKIKIVGDAKDAQKSFDSTEKSAGGLGKTLGDVGKIAGGFVIAQGLTKLPGLLSDAAGDAVKLEQNAKKAATVFGDELGTVQDWAEESAHAMGLTKSEAVTLATSMGDLLIPMGFSREEAAKMATETVGLSGALAEWSGGTVTAAQASEILTKAYLGETDGLKALGISISAAEVEQQLLKNGTADLTGEALAQAKAIATQQLIMEKSTDAQTAYAEGTDSTARKQAEATARMNEAKEMISVALLPAITAVTGAFATFAILLSEQIVPGILSVVNAIGTALMPILAPIVDFVQNNLGPVIAGLGTALVTVLVPAFIAWATTMWTTTIPALAATVVAMGPIILIAAAIGLAIGALYLAWQSNFLGIQDITKKVIDFVRPYIETGIAAIRAVIETTLAFISAHWPTVWNAIQKVVETVFPIIEAVVKKYIDLVKAYIETVLGAIQAIWDRVWPAIQATIETVWPIIESVVKKYIDIVKLYIETALGVIQAVWDRVWPALQSTAERVWAGIQTAADIINAISSTIGTVLGTIQSTWNTIWGAIQTTAETVWSGIETAVNTINAVKETIARVVGEIKEIWNRAWDAVVQKVKDIWSGAAGVLAAIDTGIRNVKGKFDGAIDWLVQAGRDIVQGLIDGIYEMAQPIIDAGNWIADQISNATDYVLERNSPSKLFYEKGLDVGRGFALGIMDSTPLAVDAAQQLAASTGGAFNYADDMSGAGTTAGGGAMGSGAYPVIGGAIGKQDAAYIDAMQGAIESAEQINKQFQLGLEEWQLGGSRTNQLTHQGVALMRKVEDILGARGYGRNKNDLFKSAQSAGFDNLWDFYESLKDDIPDIRLAMEAWRRNREEFDFYRRHLETPQTVVAWDRYAATGGGTVQQGAVANITINTNSDRPNAIANELKAWFIHEGEQMMAQGI